MSTSADLRVLRSALTVVGLGLSLLAPAGLAAQRGPSLPPLLRVTGSMAWGLSTSFARTDVTTAGVRAEVPVTAQLAPWVSWSRYELSLYCIPETTCPSDGTIWLAGLMVSPAPRGRQPVRAHLGFGIGQWRNSEEHGFARSTVLGLTLDLIPLVAPTAELRWEKFPVIRDQVMFAVGLQLAVPRPAAGR